MTFLNIYIAFSLLTFVLLLMEGYLIVKDLKRKYPEAVKKWEKDNKKNVVEKIFSYIKNLVCCFIPIVNIGIFYASLFKEGRMRVEEEVLKELDKYIKEGF